MTPALNLMKLNHLSLDISKAQFQLGWLPKWDLENAIEKNSKLV